MEERMRTLRPYARVIKTDLLSRFKNDPNIVGGAFGYRVSKGETTQTPAVVIYVAKKVSPNFLPVSQLLPRRVYYGDQYLEVDVIETGPIYIHSFTGRDRPAPSGISLGHFNITAGTLGCLVVDNTDGSICILSNNHVMADGNQASLGDAILQPGPADGGSAPGDTIANLKRFVTINPTGNVVDCALAEVTNKGADTVNLMKNNLMPVPLPSHPAVGLLFAGSCTRTFLNPIAQVLRGLNIRFLSEGSSITEAEVGMNVEKVGRTTEYLTSTVAEIDVTITVSGYPFGNATFDHQIGTHYLSEGGDSGSIVCQGGNGSTDDCPTPGGCESTNAASIIIGQSLEVDKAVEKEFRERYLSQTRIGRYGIDLYFRNEQRIVERVRSAKVSESDLAFARYAYARHIEPLRAVLLQANRSKDVLTEAHLKEIQEWLGRAKQYMFKDEAEAADQLFAIGKQAAGKTLAEILKMLDDPDLLKLVITIVSKVKSLNHGRHDHAEPDEDDK